MAEFNQSSMLLFDKEDERINDVCLVVEDRKFWCSKQHLSLHSEYFCSMFNGDFPEAKMKEIILNDPDSSKDFHLFLLIIHGLRPFDEFGDKAVTRVLALSNLWIAKIASEICMDHLLKSEKSTLKDKYVLADAYKLEDYKTQLIASIKTSEELASIVPSNPTILDQATKDKILIKSLELHKTPKTPEPALIPPDQDDLAQQIRRRLEYLEEARRNAEQGGNPQREEILERRRREMQRMGLEDIY